MRKLGLATLALLLTSLPAAAEEPYLFDVMKNPAYRQAWIAMMSGGDGAPRWLGQVTGKGNYVATPGRRAAIGGANYRFFHACEAHNCAGSQFEVMFTADGRRAYGMLLVEGHPPRWYGGPDAAMQAALAKAMNN